MPKVRLIRRKKKSFEIFRNFSRRFTAREVEHILIAWLTLSLAFGYVLDRNVQSIGFLLVLAASAIVLGCGFIMHELMHKFTAQKYRYRAEFIIWPWGILLALVTALFGFIFAAPGATYFEPDPREQYLDPSGFAKRYGIISLAGPKINIIFGFAFLLLFILSVHLLSNSIGYFTLFVFLVTGLGSYINFYLAAFNLLPINPLDGYKVFNWNKSYWAGFFVLSIIMTAINFIYVIPVIYSI